MESRKQRIVINRPFQIAITVYQSAMLRMFKAYYECWDRFVDRKDFWLIQMETDSNYMAISAERLEDIVKPELREEFEAKKERVAGMGQVKRTNAGAVQTRM